MLITSGAEDDKAKFGASLCCLPKKPPDDDRLPPARAMPRFELPCHLEKSPKLIACASNKFVIHQPQIDSCKRGISIL
jgi:hypothetical protein